MAAGNLRREKGEANQDYREAADRSGKAKPWADSEQDKGIDKALGQIVGQRHPTDSAERRWSEIDQTGSSLADRVH